MLLLILAAKAFICALATVSLEEKLALLVTCGLLCVLHAYSVYRNQTVRLVW